MLKVDDFLVHLGKTPSEAEAGGERPQAEPAGSGRRARKHVGRVRCGAAAWLTAL